MIQRVQTLYILLGTLLVTLILFFVPYIGVNHEDATEPVKLLYFFPTTMGLVKIFTIILFVLHVMSALIAVFTFKKHKLQLWSINFSGFTLGFFIGLPFIRVIILVSPPSYAKLLEQGYISFNYMYFFIFLCLLVIAGVFYNLASRSIKKDRDLINSINRLR